MIPSLELGQPADSRSLRIHIVSSQRTLGGGEVQAFLLAEGLHQRGHDVTVATPSEAPLGGMIRAAGIQHFDLGARFRGVRSMARLGRELRRCRPEVIHLADPHAVLYGGIASYLTGVGRRVGWRTTCFPIRSRRLYRLCCDAVVCVADEIVRMCREAGIDADRLHRVYSAADARKLDTGVRERGRSKLGLCDGDTLVLCAATLTSCKGHLDLIEALTPLFAQRPDLFLALAGDGQLREDLEREVQQRGIARQVLFLGHRSDMPDLLAAADLLAVASHLEGICGIIIEAMMAGLPVVTTRVGGIPELLEPLGEDAPALPLAWGVPPHQPAVLRQAIDAAISDPTEMQQRSHRARSYARSAYSVDSLVEGNLRVYQRLLDQVRP